MAEEGVITYFRCTKCHQTFQGSFYDLFVNFDTSYAETCPSCEAKSKSKELREQRELALPTSSITHVSRYLPNMV